ncbi:MAG TPA: HD domain-containing protein [Planctomycetota bacterium]|nr:HD domain-containing protein [Planctomycetota bacterium]
MTDIVLKAISYAAQEHHKVAHMRKDRKTPYIAHPFRVLLSVVREFGETDPDTLAAAALHDTLEDTHADYDDLRKEFGAAIAGYVATLSKDKRLDEGPREEAFFAALAKGPRPVRLCKIADTLDNLRDAKVGAGDLEKTIGKAEKLFEIYGGDPSVAKALDVLRAEAGKK